MTDAPTKLAIVAALQQEPDFAALKSLPPLESSTGRHLLQWLDRSGLALPFLRQLQHHNVTALLPDSWRGALCQRLAANAARTRDMLDEAQRLNAAFSSFGVTAAVLKGITLAPDFCDDLVLHHQVDFDLLVEPKQVHRAANALRSCGYSAASINEVGETCFLTPLSHIPSRADDLYALQRQRQVDLHTSLWEPCSWLPVEVPEDCLKLARLQNIAGVNYLSLSLEDKFLLQVLHAFRHSFRSWIRLSWLLEIGKCMQNHRYDVGLWRRVIARAGDARLIKSIFALVLGLVARVFRVSIPLVLSDWSAAATTVPVRAWLDHFALDWAIADWPGSLNNLFLTAEFIPDPALRAQYWRSRFLPGKAQTSLGVINPAGIKNFLRLQTARAGYVAHRAAVHLKDMAALPIQQFRWKRALASCRRLEFDEHC
jgi:Uncharacterised nucleotidyltransferase